MSSASAPLDPATAANALADQFFAASRAVDDLRLGFVPPSPDDVQLRDLSDALESQAQRFTARAVGATLAGLQGDLGRIQAATTQAAAQLAHLKVVEQALELASSLLGLGLAISSGDPATILSATQSLSSLL